MAAAPPQTLAVPRATYDAMAEEIGAEAVEEIAKVFVRDTETRLKMFESTALDSARDVIQREAHSLKSAAGTFGLSELAAAARELRNRRARTRCRRLSGADRAAACAVRRSPHRALGR
ncbi:MAG: Hpt domain-containing protein [Rhodopseudomonas palustris]|nr:Hpt domain-containing protein [Rhodopseudomonas palustris]